jgi:hypothetical protein
MKRMLILPLVAAREVFAATQVKIIRDDDLEKIMGSHVPGTSSTGTAFTPSATRT